MKTNITVDTGELVINRSKELNIAIFIHKDRVALDKLLAREITYGHSNGNIHGREQTLDGVANDKTIYSHVRFEDASALPAGGAMIVRHNLHAHIEIDGNPGELHIGLMQVWIVEGGEWKMAGRQAFRI